MISLQIQSCLCLRPTLLHLLRKIFSYDNFQVFRSSTLNKFIAYTKNTIGKMCPSYTFMRRAGIKEALTVLAFWRRK